MNSIVRKLAGFVVSGVLSVTSASTTIKAARAADAQDAFPPLGPEIPRFRFHTGSVANNRPELAPDLPDYPGQTSDWYVAQWQHHGVLTSGTLIRSDPSTADRRLGPATYSFTTADGHSHLWIYAHANGIEPVYELFERDGELREGGGQNLFLAADAASSATPLDRVIDYRLDAKITQASVAYANPMARSGGAVLAQVFTGFIVQYPDRQSGKPSTIFLQIPHASSRNTPGQHEPGEYRSCRASGGAKTIIYGANLSEEASLSFAAATGPLSHLHYSVNQYLCALIKRPVVCRSTDGAQTPVKLLDRLNSFADWTIRGIYVGLETQNRDLRAQSQSAGPQGNVSVGLQVSALHVLQHPGRPFTPADCARQP
jgi:hypothetical protein